MPNACQAIVQRNKIVDYLLNDSHADGAAKADFFRRFGFDKIQWETLAKALTRHGASGKVAKEVASIYGTRYSVDGCLETPEGRNPVVRTVWIIEKGATRPRLITAHPAIGMKP